MFGHRRQNGEITGVTATVSNSPHFDFGPASPAGSLSSHGFSKCLACIPRNCSARTGPWDKKGQRRARTHLCPTLTVGSLHHRHARRHFRVRHRHGHRARTVHRHAAVFFTLTAMMVMMAMVTLHGRHHAGRAHHGIFFTIPAMAMMVAQETSPLSTRISKAPWSSAASA